MMSETIHQTVTFAAKPAEIYRALMTSSGHAAFTGEPAEISAETGGKFTAYSGYIEGMNIQLIADKLIVQAWRAGNWKKGHWSLVTFRLAKSGTGATLGFTHAGVPDAEIKSIARGWHEHYWEKLALI